MGERLQRTPINQFESWKSKDQVDYCNRELEILHAMEVDSWGNDYFLALTRSEGLMIVMVIGPIYKIKHGRW